PKRQCGCPALALNPGIAPCQSKVDRPGARPDWVGWTVAATALGDNQMSFTRRKFVLGPGKITILGLVLR
ncbi:hypothetical protein O5254_27095, partial [Escherichia coli]|nr:hypothetical protein [Escherichia coli]